MAQLDVAAGIEEGIDQQRGQQQRQIGGVAGACRIGAGGAAQHARVGLVSNGIAHTRKRRLDAGAEHGRSCRDVSVDAGDPIRQLRRCRPLPQPGRDRPWDRRPLWMAPAVRPAASMRQTWRDHRSGATSAEMASTSRTRSRRTGHRRAPRSPRQAVPPGLRHPRDPVFTAWTSAAIGSTTHPPMKAPRRRPAPPAAAAWSSRRPAPRPPARRATSR